MPRRRVSARAARAAAHRGADLALAHAVARADLGAVGQRLHAQARVAARHIAGQTDAQIIDYFVAKYGEWILLEPKPSGFNLIAYFLPLIMLAAGIGVIYVSVKKWTRAESHGGVELGQV